MYSKQQLANSPDASPKLDDTGIKRVQAIVGAPLYYGRTLHNKLLVALSKLGSTQAAATELTKTDLSQLLNYLSTYPDDGILYRSSAMILSARSGAAVSTGNVKVRGVGVGGEDYGIGAVEDAVSGVGREVVQELAEVGLVS